MILSSRPVRWNHGFYVPLLNAPPTYATRASPVALVQFLRRTMYDFLVLRGIGTTSTDASRQDLQRDADHTG